MKIKNIHPLAKQFLLNYGNRIKKKRKQNQLTLVKMAKLLHSDISRISRIENGKINLTINEIYNLDAEIDNCLSKK